jgi:hypothetical protein
MPAHQSQEIAMSDEKIPDPKPEAAAVPAPTKPRKLTDEEKYGGSGGKFGAGVKFGGGGKGGRGGAGFGGPGGGRGGKGGKGFIDPGKP